MDMRKLVLAAGVAAMASALPAAAQTDDPFAAIKQLMDKAAGQGANALDDAEAAVDAATEALSGDEAAAPEGEMASPGMVTAGDPMSVVLGLQDYGLSARLETDDEGDPVIRSKSSGANTNVYFYGCDDNGQDCRSIAFSAGFELDEPFTADQANAWNADKRFSKSYALEDGSAQIEMDVNLMGGGITAENFADVVDWWDYSVGEYKTFIGW
jgi:Putative bacterial sensory transduction regulator